MNFEYQLVGGLLILLLGLVAVANALVESRSPLAGMIGLATGLGLLIWAWILTDGQLTPGDLPDAVFRLIAAWR